jgi:hypothetical protein
VGGNTEEEKCAACEEREERKKRKEKERRGIHVGELERKMFEQNEIS